MQPRHANRITTVALATAAALSLAFAPTPASEGSTSSAEGGECLEGYAYVEALGTPHGITSTLCIHRTDCEREIQVGPDDLGTSTAKAHYYASVPVPASILDNATCYL